MITNYFRPQNIEDTLKLLKDSNSYPLGGGTWLNRPNNEIFQVVDLQVLGLNKISKQGNSLEIDACVTLQQLLVSADCPEVLKPAIRLEAGLNIRNSATIAGVLVTCDGRSAFATVMLALDAKLTMNNENGAIVMGLGEFLPLRPRGLITEITIPVNIKSAFETVARSPLDKPVVCAALSQWSSGRTRLALGGWGKAPSLAMDGTEPDGIVAAAKSSYQEAGDGWASSEYRADVAGILANRCLETINQQFNIQD